MLSTRVQKGKPLPYSAADISSPPPPPSRKRAASVSTTSSSESIVVRSVAPKRIKKTAAVSPKDSIDDANTVSGAEHRGFEGRRLSFGSLPDVSNSANDGEANSNQETPSKSPEKRHRRLSEKALYMSSNIPDSNVSPTKKRSPVKKIALDVPSFLSSSEARLSGSIKSEPVDSGDSLRSPPRISSKNKGKKSLRTLTPIEISSSEDERTMPVVKAKVTVPVPNPSKSKPSSALRRLSHHASSKLDEHDPAVDGGALRDIASPVPSNTSNDLPSGIIPHSRRTAYKIARSALSVTPVPGDASGQQDGPDAPDDSVIGDTFTIVPSRYDLRAEFCPQNLLVEGCPMELGEGAFEYFEDLTSANLDAALAFTHLQPFANIDALAVGDVSNNNFCRDVYWAESNKPIVFSMLASVYSCNLIQPMQTKNYRVKALTVVPFGPSWSKFRALLGNLYGTGKMLGPFEYGCLLKLTSCREGNYSGATSRPTAAAATPKKNMKAFASSRAKSAAAWFERKQPTCPNFNNDIPIYDVSDTPFLFRRDDFLTMQELPRYRRYGVRNLCDVPYQSLVLVFFTLNSYLKDYSSAATSDTAPVASQDGGPHDAGSSDIAPLPTNSDSVLSFNLHSVVYHGVIPDE